MVSVLKRGVNCTLDFVAGLCVSSASNVKDPNGEKLSHLHGSS